MSGTALLDRVTDRRLVTGHDGRSGAVLERGVLDRTTPVYVRTAPPGPDVVEALTGARQVELHLWRTGVLDRLPPGMRSALVGVVIDGGRVVTVTRDLGASLIGWDTVLGVGEVRRLFAAVSAMHRCFADDPPGGLVPLAARATLFAPQRWAGLDGVGGQLATAVARGHDVVAELLPDELAMAVELHQAAPSALLEALGRHGHTLLHGDLWPVNVALDPEGVVALDWELATAGPPLMDLLSFCAAAMSQVELSRDELLAVAADALRWCTDAEGMALGAFWVLLEVGWNKALDAVDHAAEAVRVSQRADLDFWATRARRALDAGLVPAPTPRPR